MKARGPSLLQQSAEGRFAEHRDEHDAMRKRKVGASDADMWGQSENAQMNRGATKVASGAEFVRRAFDPEQDMLSATRKPMSPEDFSKLVENSSGALAGRFS